MSYILGEDMTIIDASKSQLLPQLLRKLVIALTQLSSADIDLQKICNQLNLSRGNLSNLNVEELMFSLDKAAHLAQGYSLKEFKDNELVSSLPHLIPALKDELDHIVAKAKLSGKTASELFLYSSSFENLINKALK